MATEASVARTKRRVKAKATAQTTAQKAAANARRQREWRERQADLRDAVRLTGIEDPVKTFARIAESPESYAHRFRAIHTPVWGWAEEVETAWIETVGEVGPKSQEEANAFEASLR